MADKLLGVAAFLLSVWVIWDVLRRSKSYVLAGEPRQDYPFIAWIDGEDVGVKMDSTYTCVMTIERAREVCGVE